MVGVNGGADIIVELNWWDSLAVGATGGGSSGGAGGSRGRRVGSGEGREWVERVGGSANVGDDGSDGADSMEVVDGGPEAICGKRGEVGSVWVMGGGGGLVGIGSKTESKGSWISNGIGPELWSNKGAVELGLTEAYGKTFS